MSERTGKIVAYFPANRQGKIQPDDKGPAALFYVTAVTNAEPPPKENDLVVFSAPEPRKNKKGKLIQDQASTVTISERAPEPSPQELARKARKEQAAHAKKNTRGQRRARPGDKRAGRNADRRGGPQNQKPENSRAGSTRAEQSQDSNGSNQKGRKADSGKNSRNKTRRTANEKKSIRAKVRYPTARDVGKNVFHFEFSNPALVSKKFIQWPTPADAKPANDAWRLSERNQNFFLTRTLAPLYRNFEKKSLPWAAIRGRREALLRTMERSGFVVASEIVSGPWRFGLDKAKGHVLDTSHVSFDRTYGYPIIAASALSKILLDASDNNSEISDTLKDAIAGKSSQVRCCVLDAVPTGRIQTFTIERCDMVAAEQVGGPENVAASTTKSAHVACCGDNANFVFSIALSGPGVQRSDSQRLVSLLAEQITKVNKTGIRSPQKEPPKPPQAIMF